MGVPTSEVGYTIVTTWRETTKVHKNMWWHWKNIQKDYFFQSQYSEKKHNFYEGTCFLSLMFKWFHVRKEGTFVNVVFVLSIASMGKVLLNVGDVIECHG
jgi:hypothetical protein